MPDSSLVMRERLIPQFQQTLELAAGRARRILAKYPGYTPMYTVGGFWNREGEHWTHWCEGFFPGILWLLHKQTGEREWRDLAERYSRPLEPRRLDRTVHDLGFLFLSTYLRWYRLTGDAHLRDVLIEAGRTLALRRQKGGYLASFIGPHSLFIDIMMNVGLIFWAAKATGDESLLQIARAHCWTTRRYLVLPNGGTVHEGIFDVESGRFLRPATHQGWSPESTWSRGQAWAIYGFTAAYRLCGETAFLDTARRCADYYLRRVPHSGVGLRSPDRAPTAGPGLVPYWDFDLPNDEPRLWDSSAAAIAASGFWDLAEEVSDQAQQERYRSAALGILETLCSDEFVPRKQPDWEGILLHGVYHYHKRLGVDESVAWGDYFFVEALVKAVAGKSEAAW
jgi:unsaturated chondroitin disaccharide hydrolase